MSNGFNLDGLKNLGEAAEQVADSIKNFSNDLSNEFNGAKGQSASDNGRNTAQNTSEAQRQRLAEWLWWK